MNTDELIAEFLKVDRTPELIRILVADTSWPSPSQPETAWRLHAKLPANASEAEIRQAQESALQDTLYFATCGTCRERQPAGWMHDDHICQSCATRDLGIVY